MTPQGPPATVVLVVDDESGVRDLLTRWLQAGGYAVASAADAEEALDLMETVPPAVALCDLRMPGRDGLWLVDRIRREYPETAVIMATGVHDVGAAVASLRHGVVDYLTKPFGRDRLREAVLRGLAWHRTARDSRWWRDRLEQDFQRRRARLAGRVATLRFDSDAPLDGLFDVLRDGGSDGTHVQRVAALAVSLAQAMALPPDDTAAIRRAALVHDLGKLALPEAILRKPAPLTVEEEAIVRRHPQVLVELLAGWPLLESAVPILRAIQERPDGTGYPEGLAAGAIPIGSRIVAAAEAYDLMIRPRVFRGPLTAAAALAELERCSGTQFDGEVVRVLTRLVAH